MVELVKQVTNMERLYNNFENSLKDSAGLQLLTSLFESLVVLTQG